MQGLNPARLRERHRRSDRAPGRAAILWARLRQLGARMTAATSEARRRSRVERDALAVAREERTGTVAEAVTGVGASVRPERVNQCVSATSGADSFYPGREDRHARTSFGWWPRSCAPPSCRRVPTRIAGRLVLDRCGDVARGSRAGEPLHRTLAPADAGRLRAQHAYPALAIPRATSS